MADAIYDILTQQFQSASNTLQVIPPVIAQQEFGITTFQLPQTLQEDNTFSEPADGLISLDSPKVREYLAQFIESTNNTINDLLQRVATLEAELQRFSHQSQ